jgi:NAD(P)-dependent dehydrogenase (short-subunit alcohol dehydrogenase family)
MRLAKKVALITGAASGIGQATAIRFAPEGAMVVVADIDEVKGQACVEQITTAGNQAAFIQADVGLETDLQQMVDFAPDIRVVAVLPGVINTPPWPSAMNKVRPVCLTWRIGEAEEIANATLFLASDEASYITRTGLVIDGRISTH